VDDAQGLREIQNLTPVARYSTFWKHTAYPGQAPPNSNALPACVQLHRHAPLPLCLDAMGEAVALPKLWTSQTTTAMVADLLGPAERAREEVVVALAQSQAIPAEMASRALSCRTTIPHPIFSVG